MKSYFFALLLLIILYTFPLATSAHWIVGYVENALDGTSPNDRIVKLWNPLNSQETFGIIGPSGLSSTPNVYMIDCEMLTTPCQVGDKLNLTIQNDGSGYTAKKTAQITVTGAGFDMASNLSLNTPPSFTNIIVDDILSSPANEIDLTPASQTLITCSAIIEDYEGADSIQTIEAKFFHLSSSPQSPDDNNNHYSNSSCQIDTSYGTQNQATINCTFQIEYYANPNTWQCQINATDNYSGSTQTSDTTNVNTLLSIGVGSPIDFGEMEIEQVSPERVAEVTNYGNVQINLTLSGYGQTQGDGNAMECGTKDIIIDYMKFNLTASNSSNLTIQQFETIYQNLTLTPITYNLDLNSRQNDLSNEAITNTYWRVYLPQGITSDCTGNIVFAATQT